MRSAVLEERMTNNTQDLQIAFQFGEAALREGEALLAQATMPTFNNTNGLYVFVPPSDTTTLFEPRWNDPSTQWRDAGITGDATLGYARAQYIIEQMPQAVIPPPPGRTAPGQSLQSDKEVVARTIIVYRITARAWGATGRDNPTPMVVLQSTFQRGA